MRVCIARADDLFATQRGGSAADLEPGTGWRLFDEKEEFARLGVQMDPSCDDKGEFKITKINEKFKVWRGCCGWCRFWLLLSLLVTCQPCLSYVNLVWALAVTYFSPPSCIPPFPLKTARCTALRKLPAHSSRPRHH